MATLPQLDATGEPIPKRRGRPPRDPDAPTDPAKPRGRRPRKPTADVLYQELASGIYTIDQTACIIPSWRQMRLQDAEIAALARATTNEILTYDRLLALYQRAKVASVHGAFIAAVVGIAIPRLAALGMLPPALMGALQGAAPDAAESPVPVETGGAYGGDGGYGQREEHASDEAVFASPIPSNIPVQVGPQGAVAG